MSILYALPVSIVHIYGLLHALAPDPFAVVAGRPLMRVSTIRHPHLRIPVGIMQALIPNITEWDLIRRFDLSICSMTIAWNPLSNRWERWILNGTWFHYAFRRFTVDAMMCNATYTCRHCNHVGGPLRLCNAGMRILGICCIGGGYDIARRLSRIARYINRDYDIIIGHSIPLGQRRFVRITSGFWWHLMISIRLRVLLIRARAAIRNRPRVGIIAVVYAWNRDPHPRH